VLVFLWFLLFSLSVYNIFRQLAKYLNEGRHEDAMNDAFKALADPTRREILRLLRKGPMTAGELAERFEISKPSMSHHFSVLQAADLVAANRDGRQIVYTLNTTVVQDLLGAMFDLFPTGRKTPPRRKEV
jgi:ArsR family transcriptional regulator, repressor of sdpIR and other operons